MIDAVKEAFKCSFKGRISRRKFWLTMLAFGIGYFVVTMVEQTFQLYYYTILNKYSIIQLIYSLIFCVPLLSMQVKRFHDIGKSGKWSFINIIPIIGNIIALIMLSMSSQKGENKYGCLQKDIYIENSKSVKNFHWSLLFLFFMCMSTSGNNIEALLKSGYKLEEANTLGLTSGFIGTLITMIIMMAIPCICWIGNKKILGIKIGKRICLWNSIILFVLSLLSISIFQTNGFVGGVGAVFFYFINKWTFVNKDENVKEDLSLEVEEKNIDNVDEDIMEDRDEKSGSVEAIEEGKDECTVGFVALEKEEEKSNSEKIYIDRNKQSEKIYYKEKVISRIIIGVLVFAIAIVMVLFFSKCDEYNKLKEDYSKKNQQITELKREKNTMKNVLGYYIDACCMVTEKSRYYHRYNCELTKGETYWIYNVELAEYKGFSKCPVCWTEVYKQKFIK